MATNTNRNTSDYGDIMESDYLRENLQNVEKNVTEKPRSFADVVNKYNFPDREQAIVFDATENTKKKMITLLV